MSRAACRQPQGAARQSPSQCKTKTCGEALSGSNRAAAIAAPSRKTPQLCMQPSTGAHETQTKFGRPGIRAGIAFVLQRGEARSTSAITGGSDGACPPPPPAAPWAPRAQQPARLRFRASPQRGWRGWRAASHLASARRLTCLTSSHVGSTEGSLGASPVHRLARCRAQGILLTQNEGPMQSCGVQVRAPRSHPAKSCFWSIVIIELDNHNTS